MNLLILLNAPHYLRPFVDTVRTLAGRGHRITIAWYAGPDRTGDSIVERFADLPAVRFTTVPSERSVRGTEVGLVRRSRNYLRYLEDPFRSSAKLRQRSFSKLVRLVTDNAGADGSGGEVGLGLTQEEVRRLKKALAYLESLIPLDPACASFLVEHGFDAVLVSPLVDLGSSGQVDFVKAARALEIPVGLLVYSWDNLTTKGDMHAIPDRVFVWNERQQQEAVRIHRVPVDRVVITGAPRFDEFLACRHTVTRHDFLSAVGLHPERSLITYVGSSAFVSGDELPFIAQWLAALRSSSSQALRESNVIVRPHPDVALTGPDIPGFKGSIEFDGVPVSCRRPFAGDQAVVVSTSGRTTQGLFECLWHSDAVVGLNTSAEIEAGLLGKPVFSVLAGPAADGQEATLHFHYLLKREGGFVEVAESLDAHAGQLANFLDSSRPDRRVRCRAMVRQAMRFARPLGAALPVSPLLADAIEREMGTAVSPTLPMAGVAGAADANA